MRDVLWPNVGSCGATLVCPALVAQRWFLWHNVGLSNSCGTMLAYPVLVAQRYSLLDFPGSTLVCPPLRGSTLVCPVFVAQRWSARLLWLNVGLPGFVAQSWSARFRGSTLVCPVSWLNVGLPGSCGSTLVCPVLVIRLITSTMQCIQKDRPLQSCTYYSVLVP